MFSRSSSWNWVNAVRNETFRDPKSKISKRTKTNSKPSNDLHLLELDSITSSKHSHYQRFKMFTGLVEVLARVLSVSQLDTTKSGGGGFSIVIGDCGKLLEDVQLGDSIACNGVNRITEGRRSRGMLTFLGCSNRRLSDCDGV